MPPSSHLSIPAGLTLYSFRRGFEEWTSFLVSDEAARGHARENKATFARNEVSGLVVFKAP